MYTIIIIIKTIVKMYNLHASTMENSSIEIARDVPAARLSSYSDIKMLIAD